VLALVTIDAITRPAKLPLAGREKPLPAWPSEAHRRRALKNRCGRAMRWSARDRAHGEKSHGGRMDGL